MSPEPEEAERAPDWRLTLSEAVLLDLPDLNAVCEEIARTHPDLVVSSDPITGTETWFGWYPDEPEAHAAAVKSLAPVVAALRASQPHIPPS